MRAFLLLLTGAVLLGCSPPRITYDSAPAAEPAPGVRTLAAGSAVVVVLAPFENPSADPLGWPDLGKAMSDTLVRSLRNEARVEVRPLAVAPTGTRAAMAASVRETDPDADYLVLGRVTDFHHVKAIADGSLRRVGIFGRRDEAFAAIELEVIRLDTDELAREDHLHGTSEVPGDFSFPAGYESLSARSYLFWSTPLGRACREVLEDAMASIDSLPSTRGLRLEVIEELAAREVRIAGGSRAGLASGDRLRIVDAQGAAVLDRDTGKPLEATVLSLGRNDAVAYLSGAAPRGSTLVGCRATPIESRRRASAE